MKRVNGDGDEGSPRVRLTVARGLRVLASGWPGLVGQGLTFVSTVLPILFHLVGPLADLVFASAVSTALVQAASSSIASLYPAAIDEVRAKTVFVASATLLACSMVILILAAWIAAQTGFVTAGVGAGAVYMLLAQAVYYFGVAHLVRHSDYGGVAATRLSYGIANVTLTIAACLVAGRYETLIIAASISYLVAGIVALHRQRTPLAAMVREARPASEPRVWRYLANHAGASASNLLDGVASQAAGIALGTLGPLSSAWAVVTRIGGGFSTVGIQLVAPAFEIEFSKGIRGRQQHLARHALDRAIVGGGGLGLASFAIAALLVWFSGAARSLSMWELIALGIGALFYWGPTVAISPVSKFLVMAGAERQRTVWAFSRAVATVLVLVVVHGTYGVLALSIVATPMAAWLAWLLRNAVRRSGDAPAEGHAPAREG